MSDILLQLREIEVPTVCSVHSTIEGQRSGVLGARAHDRTRFFSLDGSEMANVLLYPPLKACEWLYLKKIPWFIAVSSYAKREITRYFDIADERICVVHHGVDTEVFSPQPRSAALELNKSFDDLASRPVVLFTGRLLSAKGVFTLIQAIPKVIKRLPRVRFLFAGGGDFRSCLDRLRQIRVPPENVVFTGYVDDYFDMPKLYSLATVYVAPTFYDTLGIRVIESMSCGKAVIASAVGGIPEIVEDGRNGMLVPPGNSAILAEKICYLLENQRVAASLGKQARKTILKEFSVQKMAAATARIYERILED